MPSTWPCTVRRRTGLLPSEFATHKSGPFPNAIRSLSGDQFEAASTSRLPTRLAEPEGSGKTHSDRSIPALPPAATSNSDRSREIFTGYTFCSVVAMGVLSPPLIETCLRTARPLFGSVCAKYTRVPSVTMQQKDTLSCVICVEPVTRGCPTGVNHQVDKTVGNPEGSPSLARWLHGSYRCWASGAHFS